MFGILMFFVGFCVDTAFKVASKKPIYTDGDMQRIKEQAYNEGHQIGYNKGKNE